MPNATPPSQMRYHVEEHDPALNRWFPVTNQMTEAEADARLRDLHRASPHANYRVHGPTEGNYRNSSAMLRGAGRS